MPRIEPIEMDTATGKAAELLQELAARGGQPGPMVRAMPTHRSCSGATWISVGPWNEVTWTAG